MKLIKFPPARNKPRVKESKQQKTRTDVLMLLRRADNCIQQFMRHAVAENRIADYLRANDLHKEIVSFINKKGG